MADPGPGERRLDPTFAVLDMVDAIPPGRVMSYGDIAGCVGMASARQVGQILARHGHEVPWQRVVKSDGSPAPHKPAEQLARLRADGTPIAGSRVDMARARWRPDGYGRRNDQPRRPR